MDDLISRQAAIDALFELYEYQRDIDPTEAADLVRQGIYLAEKKIEQLPSAQPDLAQLLAYECGKASAQPETPILTVTVAPDSEEIERIVREIKDAPVMALPSAEPEIIHCLDCEFTDGDGPIADGRYWCVLHESFMYFCSDAKRRTDE